MSLPQSTLGERYRVKIITWRMELGRGHCPDVGVNPLTELLFAMIHPIVGKKLAGSDSIDFLLTASGKGKSSKQFLFQKKFSIIKLPVLNDYVMLKNASLRSEEGSSLKSIAGIYF